MKKSGSPLKIDFIPVTIEIVTGMFIKLKASIPLEYPLQTLTTYISPRLFLLKQILGYFLHILHYVLVKDSSIMLGHFSRRMSQHL